MKKQLLFIFTLGTLSLFSQSIGTTFSDQGFNFRITSLSPNEVAVTGGGSGSSITIPETATFNMESYKVVEVGTNAFIGDPFTPFTNVTFPNSIKIIGNSAFEDNNLSGTLILPESLTTIGRAAFRFNNLSEVIFPENPLTIGEEVFLSNSVSKITISNNNISVRSDTFGISSTITSIISEIANPSNFPLNAVVGTRSNVDLVIPSGTSQAYIDAGWTGFKSVTEASDPTLSISENISQESAIKVTVLDSKLVVENNKSSLIVLELYDLSGALVFRTSENIVDTAVFSKGVYILRMRFAGDTIVKKIIL